MGKLLSVLVLRPQIWGTLDPAPLGYVSLDLP